MTSHFGVEGQAVMIGFIVMCLMFFIIRKFKGRGKKKYKRGSGFTQEIKDTVWKKRQGYCQKCKDYISGVPHYDHKRPVKYGGDNKISNCQLLCANCHALKTRYE